MKIFEIVRTSFSNLSANKMRSSLTMLGVIIGVAAVIGMAAVIEEGKRLVLDIMERFGTQLLFITPKSLTEEELRAFAGRSKGLRYEDGLALKEISSVADTTPIIGISPQIRYTNIDRKGRIEGVLPSYLWIRNYQVERGRFLTQDDTEKFRRVVVLGNEIAKKIFEDEDPLDKDLRIGEHRFTVVGVLRPKGSLHGQNFDDLLFIPATTVIRFFEGTDRVNFLVIKVHDNSSISRTVEKIRQILLSRHEGVEDFSIRSQDDFVQGTYRIIVTFELILGGVAALALIVGGIGIMNIMLVTVTERTGEIGLRKAVGASRRDILIQFLIEAVILTLTGGSIGTGIGIGLGFLFGWAAGRVIPGWTPAVHLSSIFVGFFFAVAVGIFFGLHPARKASQLDPAEALRYE